MRDQPTDRPDDQPEGPDEDAVRRRLAGFAPGVTMTPLSAADVRRRGTRRRRIRTAGALVGAAALVAAVAVPIGLLRGGEDRTAPVTEDTTRLSADGDLLATDEVPLRGPYREGLGPWETVTDPEGLPPTCVPDAAALSELLAPAESLEVTFRADFELLPGDVPDPTGLPGSLARESILRFEDDAAAEAALGPALEAFAACRSPEDVGDPAAAQQDPRTVDLGEGGELSTLSRVRSSPESCPGTDCDALGFEQLGVAVVEDRLVVVSLDEIAGPLPPEDLETSLLEVARAATVKARSDVDDVAPVSPDPPDSPTESPTDSPGSPAPPPGDGEPADPPGLDVVPLTSGWGAGPDVTIEGPGPDVEAPTLPEPFCGAEAWYAEPVEDRVAALRTAPESSVAREVRRFPDEEAATGAIERLRTDLESCPEIPGSDGFVQVATVHDDLDAGGGADQVLTFGYFSDGAPYGFLSQVVRVGTVVYTSGEYAEWSLPQATESAAAVEADNQPLVAELRRLFG